MLELLRLGTATAPELARAVATEETQVTPSTVQTLLLRLQKNGLVTSSRTISHRWWQLSSPGTLPELLRRDARHILLCRYGAHPLALVALLEEVQAVLSASDEARRLA
jgi:predicted transcriptional regulator